MTDACSRIIDAGGLAYRSGDAFLVVYPIDDEWIASKSSTLEGALELAIASDGLATDDGLDQTRPHLTIEDAIEEVAEWCDGRMTLIASSGRLSS